MTTDLTPCTDADLAELSTVIAAAFAGLAATSAELDARFPTPFDRDEAVNAEYAHIGRTATKLRAQRAALQTEQLRRSNPRAYALQMLAAEESARVDAVLADPTLSAKSRACKVAGIKAGYARKAAAL